MEQNYISVPRRAKEYRQMAWDALRAVWGIAIVVSLVAAILSTSARFSINVNIQGVEYEDLPSFMQQMQRISESAAYLAYSRVAEIFALIGLIIGGPIQVGYARFSLKITRGEPVEFMDLFSGFDVFGDAFLLNLRILLRTIGWMLLFIIPGIIAAYRYSQVFYIMAEHPELGSGECINRSKAMMRGNKWNLFCLQMSFFGWFLLTIVSFGIAGLWLSPYMKVAATFFYRDVSAVTTAAHPEWQQAQQRANTYDPQRYYDPQTGRPVNGQQPPQQGSDNFWNNY